MPSARSRLVTAAVLVTLLAGCVTAYRPVAEPAELARACPAPTAPAKMAAILTYLEKASPDPGLNALATEWERLDEGARVSRGL